MKEQIKVEFNAFLVKMEWRNVRFELFNTFIFVGLESKSWRVLVKNVKLIAARHMLSAVKEYCQSAFLKSFLSGGNNSAWIFDSVQGKKIVGKYNYGVPTLQGNSKKYGLMVQLLL